MNPRFTGKKFAALITALAIIITAFSALFLSGCGYGINYDYKVGYEGGDGYYVARAYGNVAMLKGELNIPSEYGEGDKRAPVREIADEGFRGSSITKLVIPETVTKIGLAAFANCESLAEVVFSGGINLKEIPQGIFGFDTALRKITIPEGVESIGYRAFLNCEMLNTVVLPSTLKKIGAGAFEDCYQLSNVTLPQGLENIGALAFYNCALTEISVPDTVAERTEPVLDKDGNPTFDDGKPVTKTVYGLEYGAFHTCRLLKKATLGKGITTVRSGVFGFCDGLEEVVIPLSVKKIEGTYFAGGQLRSGHAFHNCASLKTVNYAGNSEDWKKIEIVNTSYTEDTATYNNNALFAQYNSKLVIIYNYAAI